MPTVLVTGASRGLGLEFCRQYAEDGWRVVATCRRPARADGLASIAQRFPNRFEVHPLDVGDEDSVRALGRDLQADSLDLLVNNAMGGGRSRPLDEIDYRSFETAMRVNAFAVLSTARTFLDRMARGQGRTLAVISSEMGSLARNTKGGRYVYRASKAAANMIVRSLAADLAERGIKVVSLHPGWVRTRLGGPDAPLSPGESVAAMRQVLARLGAEDSGRFLDRHGRDIPW